ncbi:helix-turn-helix domain-containing protein [Nocardia sp. NPDC059246]|uniref:helix-turn-helix domain-containing protein n=1 Tax=unclassified Nocardia TaxID=2637762 RepID=UPI0036D1DF65
MPAGARFPSYFRSVRGLGQSDLAKAAGIPTSTVQGIERGEVPLNDVNAAKLVAVLGISVDTLRQAYRRVRRRPPGTRA